MDSSSAAKVRHKKTQTWVEGDGLQSPNENEKTLQFGWKIVQTRTAKSSSTLCHPFDQSLECDEATDDVDYGGDTDDEYWIPKPDLQLGSTEVQLVNGEEVVKVARATHTDHLSRVNERLCGVLFSHWESAQESEKMFHSNTGEHELMGNGLFCRVCGTRRNRTNFSCHVRSRVFHVCIYISCGTSGKKSDFLLNRRKRGSPEKKRGRAEGSTKSDGKGSHQFSTHKLENVSEQTSFFALKQDKQNCRCTRSKHENKVSHSSALCVVLPLHELMSLFVCAQ